MKGSYLRDLVIGFVFLGALVLMGLVTLAVTDIALPGSTPEVVVPFDQVDGLRTGNEIRWGGFPVGLVTNLEQRVVPDGIKIDVACRFHQNFPLPPDSTFEVRSAGPLGGRHIEIVSGTAPPRPVAEGAFQGAAEGDLFEQLREVVDDFRDSNSMLNQLLLSNAVGDNFSVIMDDLREIVASVNDGEGILGAIIKREDLRGQFEEIVTDVQQTLSDVSAQRGTLGLLISDPETRDRVSNIVENAEEISVALRESRGTLGKLINESELHDQLQGVVTDISDAVGEDAEGPLAMFLHDEEFAKSLKTTVTNLEEISDEIAHGDGTIGRLVNEREIYDRLNRILVAAEDAVEDLREQAPIRTFVNALFATF